MADSSFLSILRQASLSSRIATEEWIENNFLPLSAKNTINSLSDIYVLSGEVVEGLSNVVIPKLDTISGLVEEEVEKVDEISAKFDDYSLTGHTHTSSDITNFPPIPTVNNGTLTIQKNGTNVQTFSANQSNSVTANISVPTKTSDLTNDSGFVVSSDLTKVMEYQGSVTNFSDLPNNAKKGYVYNVVSAYNNYPPGTNYAYNGTAWDPLGGSIDTSIFATVSALNKLSSEVVNGLSIEVNPKLSVIADKVEEEVAKLDELSAGLTAYAKLSDITEIPSDLSAFTNSPGYITQQSLSGLSDIYELSSKIVSGLTNVINPKLSTIADKVEEEVAKFDELSGKLSAYALTSDIPLSVSELINDAGYITSYTETDPEFNNWLSGDSIAAGNGANTTGDSGVAIGANSHTGTGTSLGTSSYSSNGVAIGENAHAAIGTAIGLSSYSSAASTAIGREAYSKSTGVLANASTAVGYKANALSNYTIAIGGMASADAVSAIQIGIGINSTQKSLQVWEYPLLLSTGDIPEARVSAIGYAKESSIPIYTSQLTNDSGFLTSMQAIPALSVKYFNSALEGSDVSAAIDQLFKESLWIDAQNENLMLNESPVSSLNINNNAVVTENLLSDYVTLSTNQEISGTKYFLNQIEAPTYVAVDDRGTFNGTTFIYPGSIYIEENDNASIISANDVSGLIFNSVGIETNGLFLLPKAANQSVQTIATEEYVDNRCSILPISSVASNSIELGTTKTVYRVTDSSDTGSFPTIIAPTETIQNGDYYYCFEIEWKTAASLASYSSQYDWINYPEMQTDGTQHTYYITGRWDSGGSGASAFTLNCWRVK